jgi:hypothetical protein
MAKSKAKGLDARAAELLARHFNTAFTTVSGYGTDHPMSTRSGEGLMEALSSAFEHEQAITLLLDRGALFVEKHPVGERFNPRRLLNLLAQTKIESFTFDRSIRLEDLHDLFDILAHQDKYPDVDAIKAELQSRECKGLRMNYVTYKKVTADQKVVSEDDGGGLAIQIDRPGGSESDTFGSMASMMSVTELLKDPAAYAERLNSSDEDKDQRQKVVRQLRHLIAQIESGAIQTEGALSSAELLKAVNSLREKVRRHHSSNRDVERLLGEDNQVLGEVDQLTYSTLVSLVREEYRSGNFSARRMAQIINRMLPDSRDLRRLMPQLKQGLLGEGMSVAEYGKLVHELSGEVRGDHVVRALEEGAESVGLDVDDIVDQIREDPSEAARLIVMSTELRRSGVEDSEQLSNAFSEYIDRISERLALDLPQKHRDGSDATRAQLERVRKFLIDQLRRQGLDEKLTLELRRKAEAQADPEAIRIAQEAALKAAQEPAGPAAPPVAEKNCESEAAEEASPPEAQVRPKLSHRVLNPANTAFFLKREIKSAQRYRTHFSVIKITIERLRQPAGPSRLPEREELLGLLPVFYDKLIEQLRDLDLIGSLDRTLQAVPMLILPMTDEAGANVVRWRLTDYLRDQIFDVEEQKMGVIATLTAASFDPGSDEEGRAFIQRIQTQHERNRAALAG